MLHEWGMEERKTNRGFGDGTTNRGFVDGIEFFSDSIDFGFRDSDQKIEKSFNEWTKIIEHKKKKQEGKIEEKKGET